MPDRTFCSGRPLGCFFFAPRDFRSPGPIEDWPNIKKRPKSITEFYLFSIAASVRPRKPVGTFYDTHTRSCVSQVAVLIPSTVFHVFEK